MEQTKKEQSNNENSQEKIMIDFSNPNALTTLMLLANLEKITREE